MEVPPCCIIYINEWVTDFKKYLGPLFYWTLKLKTYYQSPNMASLVVLVKGWMPGDSTRVRSSIHTSRRIKKRVSIALLRLNWIIIIKYLYISIIDHFLSGRNGNHLQERSMYLTFSLVQQKSLESGLEILRQKDTEVCNHIKLHQRENDLLSEIQNSNDHTFTTDFIHIYTVI